MSNFVIHHIDGTETDLISNSGARCIKSATQQAELMGSDTVTITAVSAELINISIGDRMEFFGRLYQINTLPTIKKTGHEKYEYTLVFEGPQYQLINATFLLPEETALDSFTGTLSDFIGILSDNIARLYPDEWNEPSIVVEDDSETKTLSYSGENCLQVLQDLCTNFKVEFKITHDNNGKNTLVVRNKVGTAYEHPFKFGAGGGVYELTREKQNATDLITRLYVYGGTKNLPTGYGYDHLCLPYAGSGNRKNASYVEDTEAADTYGVHEGVKNFDDIFPEYTGTVTEKTDELTFVDENFPFDLGAKDQQGNTIYLIHGKSAKITFQTGNLAGYQFEIDRSAYEYTQGDGLKVRLIQYTDNVGQTLPMPAGTAGAAAYQFAVGDKYIISDINLPAEYVAEAEERLRQRALETLAEAKHPSVTYSLNIDQIWLEKIAGTNVEVQTLFDVGDTLTVTDNTTATASLRITGYERDIIKPYKYTFMLGEKVSVSAAKRIVNSITATQKVIKTNNLSDTSRAARNWQTTQDVLSAIFDPEGNYFSEKIKPLSIETSMLAVGARSQQFLLSGVTFMPNYGGNANVFNVAANGGALHHYTINGDNTTRTWFLSDAQISGLLNQQYFIYVRCGRTGSTGVFVVTNEQKTMEGEADYYYFLVGFLSSPITTAEGTARQIVQSYGLTTINGRFISTGRIQSADGSCYIDLDTNTIHGNIRFSGANGETSVAAVEAQTMAVNNLVEASIIPGLDDLQAQIDGRIDQWFYSYDPTLTNAPASEWDTEEKRILHLSDLFYNIDTGMVWRFAKDGANYKWVLLQDTEAAKALALANDAMQKADGKRQIFTDQPVPPYHVGDVYIKTTGEVLKCTQNRENGIYYLADWAVVADFGTKEAFNSFIQDNTATLLQMQAQLDGKIETFYQPNDPSLSWLTTAALMNHVGDLWIKPTKEILRFMQNPNGGFKWELVADQSAADDAAAFAEEALQLVNGKCTTFVVTPYPPYSIGDLWLTGGEEDGELKRCIFPRSKNEAYNPLDWALAVCYDSTEVKIENGLITAGSLQIVGTNTHSVVAGITGADSGDQNTAADDVRIWAGTEKANRDIAPFRVYQDGRIVAENADIAGTITAEAGRIADFDISHDHIGRETDTGHIEGDGMSLYSDCIKFINNTTGCKSIIGTSVIADEQATPVPAYFENTGLPAQYYQKKNIALMLRAHGNQRNYAIVAEGDAVIDGQVFSVNNVHRHNVSACTTKARATNAGINETIILETLFATVYAYILLPTIDDFAYKMNMVDSIQPFTYDITYISRPYTGSGDIAQVKVIRYGVNASHMPFIINNDGSDEILVEPNKAVVLQYTYTGREFFVIKK